MLNYEDVLRQLNAKQLLELKEKLNSLSFVAISDLVLGTYEKYYYNETYGWANGDGYSKIINISYSEIILYNKFTKRDALTGENLDKTWQTRVEDVGPMGEIYTFIPCKGTKINEMTLENLAKYYQLPYQDYYSDYNILELLKFYDTFFRKIGNKLSFKIVREREEIILPFRQYEEFEDGKVRALKPLQYFKVK